MLKSVLLRSQQVIDTPVRIRAGGADLDGLQLVLSRKEGKVAGDVVDDAGNAAPDTTVIAFAENRALWGVASRFVRAVRPDHRGRFSIAGLPPGMYRLPILEGRFDARGSP